MTKTCLTLRDNNSTNQVQSFGVVHMTTASPLEVAAPSGTLSINASNTSLATSGTCGHSSADDCAANANAITATSSAIFITGRQKELSFLEGNRVVSTAMAAFRWAIISTGKIARDFASAVRQLPGHEVSAVTSRSRGSAFEFVAQHCPGASSYTSIDEMLDDSSLQVDATYVATPNVSHAPCAMRLLEAGKAVLCEKPLATTIQEVERLVAKAQQRNTFLMEGMWTRCFPATVKARELLKKGIIGPVVAVQAEFGYEIANGCPALVRGEPELGGMTSGKPSSAFGVFDSCRAAQISASTSLKRRFLPIRLTTSTAPTQQRQPCMVSQMESTFRLLRACASLQNTISRPRTTRPRPLAWPR